MNEPLSRYTLIRPPVDTIIKVITVTAPDPHTTPAIARCGRSLEQSHVGLLHVAGYFVVYAPH